MKPSRAGSVGRDGKQQNELVREAASPARSGLTKSISQVSKADGTKRKRDDIFDEVHGATKKTRQMTEPDAAGQAARIASKPLNIIGNMIRNPNRPQIRRVVRKKTANGIERFQVPPMAGASRPDPRQAKQAVTKDKEGKGTSVAKAQALAETTANDKDPVAKGVAAPASKKGYCHNTDGTKPDVGSSGGSSPGSGEKLSSSTTVQTSATDATTLPSPKAGSRKRKQSEGSGLPEPPPKRSKPLGLHRVASACFANSATQAFFRTIDVDELKQALGELPPAMDVGFTNAQLVSSNAARNKVRKKVEQRSEHESIVAEFVKLLENMQDPDSKDKNTVISPWVFQQVFGKFHKTDQKPMDGSEQMDTTEFLQRILEDVNAALLYALPPAEVEIAAESSNGVHTCLERRFKVVASYKRRCQNCAHEHVFDMADWSFYLALPDKSGEASVKQEIGKTLSKNKTSMTAKDAKNAVQGVSGKTSMKELFEIKRKEKSRLDGFKCKNCGWAECPNDCGKCNKCRNPKPVVVEFVGIKHLPENLVVRIGRECGATDLKKLDQVDLPLNGIDLGPYLVNQSGEVRYQTEAVVKHVGRTKSRGHYLTHVRGHDGWWECNDEKVTPSAVSELQRDGRIGRALPATSTLVFLRREQS